MVSVKGTKRTLAITVLALFLISVAIKIYAQVMPADAVVDTLLSVLETSYYGMTTMQAANGAIILSKLIDTITPPLIALLLATLFVEMISGLNIREKLARSKISKMKSHVVITPANSLASLLAFRLNLINTKSVIIAKTYPELDEVFEGGNVGIKGDIDSSESLNAAGIQRADCVVACADDDIKNAMICITAKAVAPKVRVISLVNRSENAEKMSSIGVECIVMPEITAGNDIAKRIMKRAYQSSYIK